jgi:hypothetical protein
VGSGEWEKGKGKKRALISKRASSAWAEQTRFLAIIPHSFKGASPQAGALGTF